MKEECGLASYACRAGESKGRQYAEPPSQARTEFQRDRDRIIHSAAFRRLEYKTQVFVNQEGDLFRTRLTHSLEVAQIARVAAARLSLNIDLTESIALAHDLGHTPFGHAGQDALNEAMAEHGGFEHNLQSLRIVDFLEEQYPDFDGLNLTWETREGILKHCAKSKAAELGDIARRFLSGTQPGLEAQLVNIADAIGYSTHDIDDGLRVGYLNSEDLAEKVPLYGKFWAEVNAEYPAVARRRREKEVIRRLIGYFVNDLVETSQNHIRNSGVDSAEDVRALNTPLVLFSDPVFEEMKGLKSYLLTNLYRHYRVMRAMHKSTVLIRELFDVFADRPELLPPNFAQKARNEDLWRTVADYIAGMTDRYALLEYRRVLDPGSGQ
jgi:dGTPase